MCGNDNKTYSSVCSLRDVACREKLRLHAKHMGSCGKYLPIAVLELYGYLVRYLLLFVYA